MNNYIKILLCLSWLGLIGCTTKDPVSLSYSSENLQIEQISEHVYQHISYINLPKYGMFPCNGLIYVHDNEAIVFDTPVDDTSSSELIYWIQDQLQLPINAVIVHHFHVDCLGGLNAFHQAGIPSYASTKTIALARGKHPVIPQNSFIDSLELSLGTQSIQTRFFGAGHTPDNVVSYIPQSSLVDA